jgi:hypothetical protein
MIHTTLSGPVKDYVGSGTRRKWITDLCMEREEGQVEVEREVGVWGMEGRKRGIEERKRVGGICKKGGRKGAG